MRRRLITFLSALSLLPLVAVCVVWVRSLGHFEMITLRDERLTSGRELRSSYAGFSWFSNTLRLEVISLTHKPTTVGSRTADPPGLRWDFVGEDETLTMNGYPAGFEVGGYPYSFPRGRRYVLAVRPWLPAAVTGVLPGVWAWRFARARRARRRGLCPVCGYDLRATPDRCPECGLVSAAG